MDITRQYVRQFLNESRKIPADLESQCMNFAKDVQDLCPDASGINFELDENRIVVLFDDLDTGVSFDLHKINNEYLGCIFNQVEPKNSIQVYTSKIIISGTEDSKEIPSSNLIATIMNNHDSIAVTINMIMLIKNSSINQKLQSISKSTVIEQERDPEFNYSRHLDF